MKLTRGEDLILKMLVNIKTDFAAFSDLVTVKLFAEETKDEVSTNKFNKQIQQLKLEKQNEIIAQLKNMYSEKIGDIDSMIDDIISD